MGLTMPEHDVLKTKTWLGATPKKGWGGPDLAGATPGSARVPEGSAPLAERKPQTAPVEPTSTHESANRSWFAGLRAPDHDSPTRRAHQT